MVSVVELHESTRLRQGCRIILRKSENYFRLQRSAGLTLDQLVQAIEGGSLDLERMDTREGNQILLSHVVQTRSVLQRMTFGVLGMEMLLRQATFGTARVSEEERGRVVEMEGGRVEHFEDL